MSPKAKIVEPGAKAFTVNPEKAAVTPCGGTTGLKREKHDGNANRGYG
jgi:hypothetical protein